MTVAVSIIVPCYNVAPYLDACLDSLVNQTMPDIEIICVNDGSTDDTPALLSAWAGRDSRVRVIDRENGGQGAARNTGMDVAEGEYIGFADPDDYVEHSMYARLLEEARRHDTDITACGYTGFSDHDGELLEKWSRSPAAGVEENVKSSSFHLNTLWMRTDVVVWNKLYRKDFLNRHHLRFETSFRAAEDDVFCLMLLPHATRVAVIPDRLYWYRRQREGSISSSWDERGAPFMIAVERLMHATEYWKKVGWLDSGLAQGWVSQALRVYLLGHFLAQDYPLPQLSEAEWLSGPWENGILPFAVCLPLRRKEPAGCHAHCGSSFPVAVGAAAVITKYAGDCLSRKGGKKLRPWKLLPVKSMRT